ncbi:MAG: hypothetical protein JOZ72_15410 [Alphaproteobacteria bacterium]|nr:hypothetical protein [Alphaproteobacteria bacterium]
MPSWLPVVVPLIGTLLGALLGGTLVIFSNFLSARRTDRRELERKAERNRAVLSGVFAIRNFIVSALDTDQVDYPYSMQEPIEAALKTLKSLVEKIPPDDQALTIAAYDLVMKLDALSATISNQVRTGSGDRLPLRIDAVLGALEQFDLLFNGQLAMLSDDDLKEFQQPEQGLEGERV